MFCDKLDFLMELTKTTNSAMGTAISLAPSHISRLRNGGRRLPRNPGFLIPMSLYLANRITTSRQEEILIHTPGFPEPLPADAKERAAVIAAWLTAGSENSSQAAETFINQFGRLDRQQIEAEADTPTPRKPRGIEYYFGTEGKREAVVRFLGEVIESGSPQTLLLYSDEPLTWLSESQEYARLWETLLSKVFMSGHKIKIIHTVNRNIDEMFHAFVKWIPIYCTGAMQPYYCPKIRDGLFFHTMFIAPQTAAVTVTTSRVDADNTLNLYHTDKRAIFSLAEEYEGYLGACKPLMRLFTPKQAGDFLKLFMEFDMEQRDTASCTQGLSLSTLPFSAASTMADRNGIPAFADFFRTHEKRLEKQLHSCKMFDIITLPDLETAKAGKVPVLLPIAGAAELYYTPAELQSHLGNIIKLLKFHENYQVTIKSGIEEPYWIYVKEESGVIVSGKAAPATFFLSEQNMSAAFWDYLQNKTGKDHKPQRERAIRKIEGLIASLD